MGLSKNDINLIKSTVPLFEQSGEKIAARMYDIMFSRYSEVLSMFEGTNIVAQHKKLASMVIAFAKNVDNLAALINLVEKVSPTHVKKGVKPEHYSIVGLCFLQAIMDVTGKGADSPVMQAWGRGFMTFAGILIDREKIIRETAE